MASLGRVTHIVVHYSATAPNDDVDVETIRKWHLARGFSDIGYHYVIYRDGSVHKGRDENVRGAHVGGQNTGKIGICWLGGVAPHDRNTGINNMSEAQNQSLISLIHELLDRHPGAAVVGHRDLAATQCPGFDVIPWWEAVMVGKTPPPPRPRPQDPVRTEAGSMPEREDSRPIGAAIFGAIFTLLTLGIVKYRAEIDSAFKKASRPVKVLMILVPIGAIAGLWFWLT